MLQISQLKHSYDGPMVLDGVDLTLGKGRIGCLLGNSGCGKTTLLRCIAGLEQPASGSIVLDGTTLSDQQRFVMPEARAVGLVFQDFALLPHLSVAANVAFGLSSLSADQRAQRVKDMLALVELEALAPRFPHELSGGQQQRVALARSLARQPKLLLMDEPFSSLDAGMRQQLGSDIRGWIKALDTTALFVTHDQTEAFSLADDIGIMQQGQLLQWDSAYRVYHQPASRAAADFIGEGVWLPGTIDADGQVQTELGLLTPSSEQRFSDGQMVDVLLRPDDVVHIDDAPLRAEIVSKQFRGAIFLYELRLATGTLLQSLVPSHHDHNVGEAIGIVFDTEHCVVFAAEALPS
ncbi:MAG: ABC transporter ATP-binding protein [Pseudomonadota bacterium]